MKVYLITPAHFCAIGLLLRPLLSKALEASADEWTVEDAMSGILCGDYLLFGVYEKNNLTGIAFGHFVHYPRKTVFRICALAGKFTLAGEALKQLEILAKAGGATELEACCRDSMVRYAKRYGFAPRYTVIRKPLGE